MKPLALALSIVALAGTTAHAQWSSPAPLSSPRALGAAVSINGLALFAGGRDLAAVFPAPVTSSVIDVYDSGTGAWSTAALSQANCVMGATVVGNLAMFAGGLTATDTVTDVVDIYDASIGLPNNLAAWSSATLSQSRAELAAATVGTKALFAGGAYNNWPSPQPITTDRVDIYDSSLGAPSNPAAWSTHTLSLARRRLAAVTVGNKVLFAGGASQSGSPVDSVDIYDDSTGLWSVGQPLSQARILDNGAAVSVGSLAFFAGGQTNSAGLPPTSTSVVDIYNAATGAWSTANLSVARAYLNAASLGNTVLFAGGADSQGTYPGTTSSVVDMYNVGTGQWTSASNLSVGRGGMLSTTVAGKAIFAGGATNFVSSSAVVDIFEPVGVNYCLATANSTGNAATISATGSASLVANNLVLRADGVPNTPFLFIHGASQAELPFGNGFLCVGGGIRRIQPSGVASAGVAQTIVDLPLAGLTTPGVRNFQCWFRDAAAGGSFSNTSDAIQVTFVP